MPSPKLAAGLAVLFCSFVAILMIILYYPKDAVEEEFDTPKHFTYSPSNNIEVSTDEYPQNSFKDYAKTMEDLGAAFLALLAVGLLVAGLVCLFCAYIAVS